MAITDRREVDAAKIPNAERFKPNMILSREVGDFYDEDFWGKDKSLNPKKLLKRPSGALPKNGTTVGFYLLLL
jgi:hypothetical protein